MNKQDLISIVAEVGDLPKAKAGDVLDAVFDSIAQSLTKQTDVRLVGFGTFSVSKRKAGKGQSGNGSNWIADEHGCSVASA